MTYVSPDIAAVIATFDEVRPPPAGSVEELRELSDAVMAAIHAPLAQHVLDVEAVDHHLPSPLGPVLVRHYLPPGTAGTRDAPAVVFVHGGGLISGSVDIYDPVVRTYAKLAGVQVFAVGYHLAPRGTSAPAEDVVAAIRWLLDRADELGIASRRIAVMGDSAGGGVAAGAAILARDEGIDLAAQILIYPMLDDRKVHGTELLAFPGSWDYSDNDVGWSALLGADRGAPDVSPAAAPARLTDFVGLAPAYLEVGDLDIFCTETLTYAASLAAQGVSTEVRVWSGMPHAFEWVAPDAVVSREAWQARIAAMQRI